MKMKKRFVSVFMSLTMVLGTANPILSAETAAEDAEVIADEEAVEPETSVNENGETSLYETAEESEPAGESDETNSDGT